MKFKKEWPTRSGYYWYVDLEYPIPKIGFIQGNVLYTSRDAELLATSDGVKKWIRIGDLIEPPDTRTNEFE
jgi:hypothetical protein